jgi:hypothetical protein
MSRDKKKAPSLTEKTKTSNYQTDKNMPTKPEIVAHKKGKK